MVVSEASKKYTTYVQTCTCSTLYMYMYMLYTFHPPGASHTKVLVNCVYMYMIWVRKNCDFLLKISPSKICDMKLLSHQHIHAVCCRGEVEGLVTAVHGDTTESAVIAGVRVVLNTNLLSVLQA